MNEFDYNTNLSPAQTEAMDDLARSFSETLGLIKSQPDSREKSLAITNLQQAAMWARQAISRMHTITTPGEVVVTTERVTHIQV